MRECVGFILHIANLMRLPVDARYYTDRALAPFDKSIPFNANVDPNHVLAKLQPEEFIHRPDNVVEYCKKVWSKDGDIR